MLEVTDGFKVNVIREITLAPAKDTILYIAEVTPFDGRLRVIERIGKKETIQRLTPKEIKTKYEGVQGSIIIILNKWVSMHPKNHNIEQ